MLADMSSPRILPRFSNITAQTDEPKSSSSTQTKPQNQTSQNPSQGTQNPSQRNDSFAYSIPGYSQPTAIKYMKLEKNKESFFTKLFNLA